MIVMKNKTVIERFSLAGSIILLIFCLFNMSHAEDTWQPGIVRFETDSSTLFIPHEIWGMIFDTSDCDNHRTGLPKWRFIGNLKIDSIMYMDSTVPFMEAIQLEAVHIGSSELLQIMAESKTHKLQRMYPWILPHDTLFWDSIRVKWHTEPDLSRRFKIIFTENVSVDSVSGLLDSIPTIIEPMGFPIPNFD